MRAVIGVVFLSNAADVSGTPSDAPLPSEFLIFRAGENPSTKGSVMFDARAASLVMAEVERWGNDYMIDLEHNSLLPRLVDSDNTDNDARGWFRPELRDGELWATRVTWTADGEARLRQRRQRYISPAFLKGEDAGNGMPRVTELINVALVAMPATNHLEALVASGNRRTYLTDRRKPDTVPDRMAEIAPAPEADNTPAPVPAEAEAAPESSPPAPTPEEPPAPAVDPLTADERAELAAFRAERDRAAAAERRSLVTDLVALGAETPATAWENGAPVARLAAESLDGMRARVAALRSAKPAAKLAPPAHAELDGLTDFERRDADKIKNPEARARFIAARLARKQK